jgi:hypothetical protein
MEAIKWAIRAIVKTQDEFVFTLSIGKEGEAACHKEYLEFEL